MGSLRDHLLKKKPFDIQDRRKLVTHTINSSLQAFKSLIKPCMTEIQQTSNSSNEAILE